MQQSYPFQFAFAVPPLLSGSGGGWKRHFLRYPHPVSYTHLDVYKRQGKCCVSGACALNIDYKARTVEVDGVLLKEGDYISLNGSTGEVYLSLIHICRSKD